MGDDPRVLELAQRLTALAPAPLDRVMFLSAGAESIERDGLVARARIAPPLTGGGVRPLSNRN